MRRQYALKALGVIVCFTGAFWMVTGESILGAVRTGIVEIVGIVGLGMLTRTRRMMH